MAQKGLEAVVRYVRRITRSGANRLDDRQLLKTFSSQGNAEAFAALVDRHGKMVLGVCRRVLGDGPDADDVFQATFLVLARKAGSVRWRPSVGLWLSAVAYRLAKRVQLDAGRRRALASQVATRLLQESASDVSLRELQGVVDEEIQRLPEKLRAPVVLCYLEGQSNEQAARQLGCSLTTIKGRLTRARELLRPRSSRRGFGPAVVLTYMDHPIASGPLPGLLARSTIKVAVLSRAGEHITAEVIPATVTALANSAFKVAGMSKLKLAAAMVLTISTAAGAGAIVHRTAEWQGTTHLVRKEVAKGDTKEAPGEAPADEKQPRKDLFGDPLPDGAIARIGTRQLRSQGFVNVIAFSHDGRHIAYGDEEGHVYISEWKTGKTIGSIDTKKGHERPVTELAFSIDDKTLAVSGFWLPGIRLFDVATRKLKLEIPNTSSDQETALRKYQGPGFVFAPDGKTLVAGGKDGAVHVWDHATGKKVYSLSGAKGTVLSLTITTDGSTALTSHVGGEVHLWSLSRRKHERKLDCAVTLPQFVVLAPDGKTIAMAASSRILELREPNGKLRHELACRSNLVGISFTPEGNAVQTADGEATITTWDVATGKKQGSQQYLDLREDPDARRLLTKFHPMAWFGADGKEMAWGIVGTVHPWDLVAKKEATTQGLFWRKVVSAAFTSDGSSLLVATANGEIGISDAWTGQIRSRLRKPEGSYFGHVTMAADRSLAVVTSTIHRATSVRDGEGRLYVWDSTKDIDPTPVRGQVDPAWYATLTPDNKSIVATEFPGVIRVYDRPTGQFVRSFAGTRQEYRPTFSPDGKLLATVQAGRGIRIYDFGTGRVLYELKAKYPAQCIGFSPDGRILASAHGGIENPETSPARISFGGSLYMWDVSTGRRVRQFSTGVFRSGGLQFSPDGTLLAGADDKLRIYEAASGQERRQFDGRNEIVSSVDFSPDGRRVVSAGQLDGTALVWRIFDPAPAERSAEELESLWADLIKDGKVAHKAVGSFIAARQTAGFLKGHVKLATGPTEAQVEGWLSDLGSSQFKKREAAQNELMRAGELVERQLTEALSVSTDAEVRSRLSRILESIAHGDMRPEQLRELRVVEVLGHIDSDEARGVLQELAKGAPEAAVTRQARSALARRNKQR